jgi:hypothetical protein
MLEEIIAATGCQKRTVRGLTSILNKKGTRASQAHVPKKPWRPRIAARWTAAAVILSAVSSFVGALANLF